MVGLLAALEVCVVPWVFRAVMLYGFGAACWVSSCVLLGALVIVALLMVAAIL